MQYKAFTGELMRWHFNHNKREMPWKGEKDPYKVWLSEVILQQTRVEQGRAYYEKFIHRYPAIEDLAKAKDGEIFKLWEGLGYYNRCKNLLLTARYIVNSLNGKFPAGYRELLSLKGIGSYTAAAIASFCFDLPYPVIDGNVFRVLARVSGIDKPTDSNKGKKIFQSLAEKLIDKNVPGAYNQAIMDFGATVCKPFLPLCSQCPLQHICVAYRKSAVNILPVKEKTLQKKLRWFTYFVFESGGKIFVQKRTAKDIWQNLFEFYLLETGKNPAWTEALLKDWLYEQLQIRQAASIDILPAGAQQLTHQDIRGYFIKIALPFIPASLKITPGEWLSPAAIQNLAFPGFINQYLHKKDFSSNFYSGKPVFDDTKE